MSDQRMLEDMTLAHNAREQALAEARAEIEKLRAALEFYSDPARWMKSNGVTDEAIPDFYHELNFGERALMALNQ